MADILLPLDVAAVVARACMAATAIHVSCGDAHPLGCCPYSNAIVRSSNAPFFVTVDRTNSETGRKMVNASSGITRETEASSASPACVSEPRFLHQHKFCW
ncbi:hypothetical protein HDK77DRAFT_23840 [Phyllosticta capitalensis]